MIERLSDRFISGQPPAAVVFRREGGAATSEYTVIAGIMVAIIIVITAGFRTQLTTAISTLGCRVAAAAGANPQGCASSGSGPQAAGAGPAAVGPYGLQPVTPPGGANTASGTAGAGGAATAPPTIPPQVAALQPALDKINQNLKNRGVYVRNFFQGDPTLVVQGLYNLGGGAWDYTVGLATGANGQTCEGYVNLTFADVTTAVQAAYPGAKVEKVLFFEKSSINPSGVGGTMDSWNDENHNVIKVTLPDGTEWAVDFHQANSHLLQGRTPPIMRPWSVVRKEWEDYLGPAEFDEMILP